MNIKKMTRILLASILTVCSLTAGISAEEVVETEENENSGVSEFPEEVSSDTDTEEVTDTEETYQDNDTDMEEISFDDERIEFTAGELNADIGVGDTESISAEVRIYTDTDTFTVKDNVHYTWEYDSDASEITDSKGNVIGSEGCTGGTEEFHITRVQTWETSLTLTAEWTDPSGKQESDSKTYTLNELYYDIWLESEGTSIFSDGDFKYTVHTENINGEPGTDYELAVSAGGYTEDGEEKLFAEDQEYTLTRDTIIIDGKKVFEEGIKSIFLSVAAEHNGYQLCYTESDCEVVEAQVDYQFAEDQKMLPGRTGTVKEEWQGTAYNAAHPEKEIFTYNVTDVTVISENPAEAGNTVVSVAPDFDHQGWVYTAENIGEATLQVTYTDIYGESQSYTFVVQVLEDVYSVSVKSDNGSDQALPGASVNVTAYAEHQSEEDTSLDGVTYEWNIKNGSDRASISKDENDPAKAVINFRELKDDESYVNTDVTAEVVLYVNDEEQCRGEITIKLTAVYYELLPAENNTDILPGNTSDITAEVRKYSVGEEYTVQDDVHYRWEYDDTAVEILDESGAVVGNYDDQGNYNDSPDSTGSSKKFTIHRLNNASVIFKLIAEWKDEAGNTRKDVREYKLNSIKYTLSLNETDPAVYDDADKTFTVSADVPSDITYEIRYEAGLRDQSNTWTEKLTEGTEFTSSSNEITFDGVKTAAKLSGTDQFDLRAILFINDVQICDAVFAVKLIDACTEHTWKETIIRYPTYDTKGLKKQVCTVCGEERTAEIPELEKIKPTSLKFLDSTIEVALGGGMQIAYELKPEDAYDKFIWTSSNENVAVVDEDGIVIAKGYGQAVIQAVSVINPQVSDKLTVIVSGSATGITLDQSEAKLFIGDSLTLKPTFTPAGKTAAVIWTSSDPAAATVDENGNVTAVGSGTAEITASIGEGINAKCTVIVSNKTKPVPTSISFESTSLEMPTEDTLQLSVKVSPENADDTATWTSSNESAATVDVNGVITAKTYGKTTITAVSKVNPQLKAEITVQTRFYDVNDNTQSYYKPVYWGADNGVVAGYDKGVYFGPDNDCTRAQFVTFLWRLAGRQTGDKDVSFPDVDPNESYYRAVKWAVSEGIIVGYKHEDGPATFEPNGTVTRGQVATMLWRFAGRKTPDLPSISPFSDIDASNSSYRAVVWGQKAGVIKGYKDGTFQPDASCLRQHIVTFLYRYARDVMKKPV